MLIMPEFLYFHLKRKKNSEQGKENRAMSPAISKSWYLSQRAQSIFQRPFIVESTSIFNAFATLFRQSSNNNRWNFDVNSNLSPAGIPFLWTNTVCLLCSIFQKICRRYNLPFGWKHKIRFAGSSRFNHTNGYNVTIKYKNLNVWLLSLLWMSCFLWYVLVSSEKGCFF